MSKFFEQLFPWKELRRRVLECQEDWFGEGCLLQLARKRTKGKEFREALFQCLEKAQRNGKNVPKDITVSPAFLKAYCWSLVQDYQYENLLEARRVLDATRRTWSGLLRDKLLFVICFWLGDWTRAKALARKGVETDPKCLCFWRILAYICWVETQNERLVGQVLIAGRKAGLTPAGLRSIMHDISFEGSWQEKLCEGLYFDDPIQVRAFKNLLTCWIANDRDRRAHIELAQAEGVRHSEYDGQHVVGWLEKEDIPVRWSLNWAGFANLDEVDLRASIHNAKEICAQAEEPIRKITMLMHEPAIVEWASAEQDEKVIRRRKFLLKDEWPVALSDLRNSVKELIGEWANRKQDAIDPRDTAWIRQERILEEVHANVERGRWQKNIEAIRFIPPQQRSMELAYHLAQAYMKTSRPGDMVRWEHTLRLYFNIEKRLGHTALWHKRVAFVLEQLHKPILALGFYEQVLALEPTNTEAKERIEQIKTVLSLKHYSPTFPRMVRQAWAVFEANESMIREMIRKKVGLDMVVDLIRKTFSPFLDKVDLNLVRVEKTYRLRIAMRTVTCLGGALYYLVTSCPAQLRANWRFDLGVPMARQSLFSMMFSSDDVDIYVRERHGALQFQLYNPKFESKELEPAILTRVAWQFLASVLHEAVLVRLVNKLELVMERPQDDWGEPHKIGQLQEYLESKFPQIVHFTFDQLMQQFETFTLEPKVKKGSLQERILNDIYEGGSLWPSFYMNWEINDRAALDILEPLHMDVGMIAMTLDHCSKKTRAERAKRLEESCRAYLQKYLSTMYGEVFGYAHGEGFTYVELFPFDITKVIEAIRRWHKTEPRVESIYYMTYFIGAHPVRISNQAMLLCRTQQLS